MMLEKKSRNLSAQKQMKIFKSHELFKLRGKIMNSVETIRQMVMKKVCNYSNHDLQKAIDVRIDWILRGTLDDDVVEVMKSEASELAKILLRRTKK